jgi:hypothetical protein
MYKNFKAQAAIKFLVYKTKSFIPRNSKCQAAMEFLMTYGWALLVVLIAIAALVFFGLLNPSRFLPERAYLSPGLMVSDAYVDQGNVILIVYNGLGETLNDFNIIVDNCDDSPGISDSIIFPPGIYNTIKIPCRVNTPVKSRFNSELKVSYSTKVAGHNLYHTKVGEIRWNVQAGNNFIQQCEITGGDITYLDSNGENPQKEPYNNGYKVHTYTKLGDSVFDVTSIPCEVEYLIVAGGGGGGGRYGGGGGGGQVKTGSLNLVVDPYPVFVGNGGIKGKDNWPSSDVQATDGMPSSFAGIITNGGIKGNTPTTGGASGDGYSGGTGVGTNPNYLGGGGGGATSSGTNAVATVKAGDGGNGFQSSISGISLYYGGGGGGGVWQNSVANNGIGGIGGGGAGQKALDGTHGQPNTGGGGGGGGKDQGYGGNGGSGIVIIRYKYNHSGGNNNNNNNNNLIQKCEGDGGYITYLDSSGQNPVSNNPYPNGYKVHVFISNNNFILTSGPCEVEYLIVGGGGGSGGRYGGGGGGGQIKTGSLNLVVNTYPASVGNGGIKGKDNWPSTSVQATDGVPSSFAGIISIGGVKGNTPGTGGASGNDYGGGIGVNTNPNYLGGGGGGFVSSGTNAIATVKAGDGGDGFLSSINGIPSYYGGGGGGGVWQNSVANNGIGGLGGGGEGQKSLDGTNGQPNTGGGAGGGGKDQGYGGDGGSGIIIIRYKYNP